MAGSNPARRDSESIDDFMKRRRREVAARDHSAEAASHEALGRAARSGQDLHLPTTSDVKAFGARLNRNPVAIAAAGEVAQKVGNVAGVVRGGAHMVEGLVGGAKFVSRAINPLDPLISAPGQSAAEQVVNTGRTAIAQGVDYARRVGADAGLPLKDIQRGLHKLSVDLDPYATPSASTVVGEVRRKGAIGANQGELAANIASVAAGAPEINVLTRSGRLSGPAEFIADGFSPAGAKYLAEEYRGMGHHYIKRSSDLWKKLGNETVAKAIMDSPFNVSIPRRMNRGQVQRYHVQVDEDYHGGKLPKRVGGERWSAKSLGITKYGPIGRAVFGAPDALKSTVGGITGAVGGLAHDLTHREDER